MVGDLIYVVRRVNYVVRRVNRVVGGVNYVVRDVDYLYADLRKVITQKKPTFFKIGFVINAVLM